MNDAPLTPKTHNKRRSVVSIATTTTSISDNTTTASNDDINNCFDCQSLQRSLKRVRLTSNITPGELRLERDLRHAVLNQKWIPISEDEWKIQYISGEQPRMRARTTQEGVDDGGFILPETKWMPEDDQSNVSVTMTRDEQDPMELILRIVANTAVHLPIAGASAATTRATTTTTTLHLQFPRMYPHRPPTVCRIQNHQQPASNTNNNNPSRWVAGNLSHSNYWNSSSCSSSSSRSPCPHNNKLQRIIIAASPDCAVEATAAATPGTVVVTEWSPVSRLTDICEWLIDIVLSHQQQHAVIGRRRSPQGMSSSSEPSIFTTCNCTNETMLRQRVSCEQDEKKDDGWCGAATESSPSIFWNQPASSNADLHLQQQQPYEVLSSLPPAAQFDTGYERKDDSSQDINSQEAMDFQYAQASYW
jgi:hypothetical protein